MEAVTIHDISIANKFLSDWSRVWFWWTAVQSQVLQFGQDFGVVFKCVDNFTAGITAAPGVQYFPVCLLSPISYCILYSNDAG